MPQVKKYGDYELPKQLKTISELISYLEEIKRAEGDINV
jgi:hypothetical protein